MSLNDRLDFLQVRRREISGNGIFDGSCGVAVFQRGPTVSRAGQQPVQDSGNVGVAAADPVHDFDVAVWLLYIE